MKLINHRSSWSVEGRYIGTIHAGTRPTADEMLAYYHLRAGEPRYSGLVAAMRWDRVVLLKPNGNFLIAPITPDISEITV